MINYYERVKGQPEIFHQLTCKELLFAKYNCPLEQQITDKWWQHHYFMYIVTGKEVIRTPNQSWMLTPGRAVFIKKGACIMEKFFDDVLCIMSFFVPDSYFVPFLRENSSLLLRDGLPDACNDTVVPIELNNAMTAFYDSMSSYFLTKEKPPEQLLELKFRELLLLIISNPINKELHAYLKTLLPHQADNLHQIMEANCLFNLSQEDYAKLCNRSLSSFKRDFQLVYKVPPGQWLLEKRVNYAQKLIITTDKSIGDVCFESGFESSTHFSRVFKEHFGIAPLQYRKQTISIHRS